LTYQWLKNGTALAGATNSGYTIPSFRSSDAGSYNVRVSSSAGAVTSSAAVVTVLAIPPAIVAQPRSQSVVLGASIAVTVQASGTAALSYRWMKDGAYVSSASSSPDFSIGSIQAGQAGNYSAEVSNSAGKVVSQQAAIVVVVPPVISQQPVAISVRPGA